MTFNEFCEEKEIVLLKKNFAKFCKKQDIGVNEQHDYETWFKLRGQWLDSVFDGTKV